MPSFPLFWGLETGVWAFGWDSKKNKLQTVMVCYVCMLWFRLISVVKVICMLCIIITEATVLTNQWKLWKDWGRPCVFKHHTSCTLEMKGNIFF